MRLLGYAAIALFVLSATLAPATAQDSTRAKQGVSKARPCSAILLNPIEKEMAAFPGAHSPGEGRACPTSSLRA